MCNVGEAKRLGVFLQKACLWSKEWGDFCEGGRKELVIATIAEAEEFRLCNWAGGVVALR